MSSTRIMLEAARELQKKIIEITLELERKHGDFNPGFIIDALAMVSAITVKVGSKHGRDESSAEDFKDFFTEYFNSLPILENDEH